MSRLNFRRLRFPNQIEEEAGRVKSYRVLGCTSVARKFAVASVGWQRCEQSRIKSEILDLPIADRRQLPRFEEVSAGRFVGEVIGRLRRRRTTDRVWRSPDELVPLKRDNGNADRSCRNLWGRR